MPLHDLTTIDRWIPSRGGAQEVHRSTAAEVASELARDAGAGLVLLSGSIAAGLGHAHSDLDLHVVAADTHLIPRQLGRRNDLRVQAIAYDLNEFRRICALGSSFDATRAERGQSWLSDIDRWTLMRVAIGIPILEDGAPAELWHTLDPTAIRRTLMANFAHPVDRAAEDALGALQVGDIPMALYSSAYAMRHAVEVALAATGDLYCVEKFLFARAGRNATLAHAAARLWELTCCSLPWGASDAEVEPLVHERLLWATHLVCRGLCDGWEGTMDALEPPATDRNGPVRTPGFGLGRFADGWALAGPEDVGLAISDDMAKLWGLLDGRPLAEVARAMTALNGADVSETQVADATEVFRVKGAVDGARARA